MSSPGVPAIPEPLASAPELEHFLALWRRVLAWDAAAGLKPLSTPHTVLAVDDSGLRRMTPMDVSDPFMVDEQLQRTLLRRHVITETVPATDPRFASGGKVPTLGGGQVTLSQFGDQPAFTHGTDRPPSVGRAVGKQDGDVVSYIVDGPFVNCSEISDAIGRHPQTNPFAPPEPEFEPEPEPEPAQ